MEKVILGISLGRKVLAMAVMKESTLHDWSITTNTPGLAGISAAIHKYSVTHIAIMCTHPSRSSPMVRHFVKRITSLAHEVQLPVTMHPIDELRNHIPGGPYSNKKSLFGYLSELFPELAPKYHKYRLERNPYWNKLFEAVACAYKVALSKK